MNTNGRKSISGSGGDDSPQWARVVAATIVVLGGWIGFVAAVKLALIQLDWIGWL